MGYGNPLFDGDQPLPRNRPRRRVLSLRLWLSAILAGTLGDGAAFQAHDDEEDRGTRSAHGHWRPGERSQHR